MLPKERKTNVRTKRSCSRARLSSGSCADKLIAPARGPGGDAVAADAVVVRPWRGQGGEAAQELGATYRCTRSTAGQDVLDVEAPVPGWH